MYVTSQTGYAIFVSIFNSMSILATLRNLLIVVWEWFELASKGCDITKINAVEVKN